MKLKEELYKPDLLIVIGELQVTENPKKNEFLLKNKFQTRHHFDIPRRTLRENFNKTSFEPQIGVAKKL